VHLVGFCYKNVILTYAHQKTAGLQVRYLVPGTEDSTLLIIIAPFKIYLTLKDTSFINVHFTISPQQSRWRSAPQGSPRTPAKCIAATAPGLMVRILKL